MQRSQLTVVRWSETTRNYVGPPEHSYQWSCGPPKYLALIRIVTCPKDINNHHNSLVIIPETLYLVVLWTTALKSLCQTLTCSRSLKEESSVNGNVAYCLQDHMWQHKQEERELKRSEGDIIKSQRSLRKMLRDYENGKLIVILRNTYSYIIDNVFIDGIFKVIQVKYFILLQQIRIF